MGNKIMQLIIIILAIIVETLTLRVWFVCQKFSDLFHFASININLQLTGLTNDDSGTPLIFTRIFHNKPIQILIDSMRLYLQFWDVRFGANWFSLIGYFGIFAGFYYIVANNKKKFYHWLILAVILLLPFTEIFKEFHFSLIIKSFYLWLPFILFSLYGIYQFLTHGILKKRIAILVILILISFWWILFLPQDMQRYCVK